MCSSPGFSKPTHGYGTPFGYEVELSSPEVSEIDPRVREVFDQLLTEFGPSSKDDENWAGKGFTKPYEEA